MNPVTATLLEQLDWPEFEAWVERWDRLGRMFLAVYRSGLVSSEQREEYRGLREILRRDYKAWQAELSRYWRVVCIAGEQLEEDPFMVLTSSTELSVEDVDWAAVQKLPAAREALNSFLLDEANRRKDAT